MKREVNAVSAEREERRGEERRREERRGERRGEKRGEERKRAVGKHANRRDAEARTLLEDDAGAD